MQYTTVRFIAVVLALAGAIPAHAQDRFAAFGLRGDSVAAFLAELQAAVRHRDTLTLASMVEYPLAVNDARGHERIQSRHDFLVRYDSVFTPTVREVVLAQPFDDLFVNSHGVMIGQGQLWLSGICDTARCDTWRLRIMTVNRDAPLPEWLAQPQHR